MLSKCDTFRKNVQRVSLPRLLPPVDYLSEHAIRFFSFCPFSHNVYVSSSLCGSKKRKTVEQTAHGVSHLPAGCNGGIRPQRTKQSFDKCNLNIAASLLLQTRQLARTTARPLTRQTE